MLFVPRLTCPDIDGGFLTDSNIGLITDSKQTDGVLNTWGQFFQSGASGSGVVDLFVFTVAVGRICDSVLGKCCIAATLRYSPGQTNGGCGHACEGKVLGRIGLYMYKERRCQLY